MRRHQDPLLSRETILWLQSTCGNRAVQRLLARKAMQRAAEQQLLKVIFRQEGNDEHTGT